MSDEPSTPPKQGSADLAPASPPAPETATADEPGSDAPSAADRLADRFNEIALRDGASPAAAGASSMPTEPDGPTSARP